MNWIEKNNKLSVWQGGFRKRQGCNIQCFRLMATILSQFSKVKGSKNKNQGRTFACFVDFRKAYDSVMHRLLWEKLTLAGISTKVINFLKSLYKNISCRVKVGAFLSKEFLYSIGVRQGCILSPLHFNIFINDIVDIIEQEEKGTSVGDTLS